MNNTNVLELWYLTDGDVSSYTGHYDMQIAYLFGFVFVQANAIPAPLLIVASRLLRHSLNRLLRHSLNRLLRHSLNRLLSRLLRRLFSLILSRLLGRLYYCV